MRKKVFVGGVVGAAMMMGTLIAHADPRDEKPVVNVSPQHGNIWRAQELSRQAYDLMTEAQRANEFDMGGHADRAKDLLAKANEEMKLAAKAANRRD